MKAGPGRGHKGNWPTPPEQMSEYQAALLRTGVSRLNAWKWQMIATIPGDEFEQMLASGQADFRRAYSTNTLVEHARRLQRLPPSSRTTARRHRREALLAALVRAMIAHGEGSRACDIVADLLENDVSG